MEVGFTVRKSGLQTKRAGQRLMCDNQGVASGEEKAYEEPSAAVEKDLPTQKVFRAV